MKLFLTLFTAIALTAAATFAADTPADIAADYREKAAAALTKVNETLEKATVPLVAALVKSGDTAGADLLKEQLKAKTAGEPVAAPQPTAAGLFKSYDTARTKALEPAQKAAVARIDAVLASSEGKKLDVVSELGKVRAEIEAGKVVASTFPKVWAYHMDPKTPPSGTMTFKDDGSLELKIQGRKSAQTGTWKPSPKKHDVYDLVIDNESFPMIVQGADATLDRPIGKRFLKVLQQP